MEQIDWEERAGILEYDAGMDRDTAEAKATLMELRRRKLEKDKSQNDAADCPAGMEETRA